MISTTQVSQDDSDTIITNLKHKQIKKKNNQWNIKKKKNTISVL